MERRLAAILAADVVGYTGLMERDEVGTHQRLVTLRHEVIDPLVREHRGEIFKTMGDGLLVHLSSVVDALECALAWQDGVVRHQQDQPAHHRFRFRIGVNLGDVMFADGDVHGDGVNIAARLESLAEPGDILVSASTWHHARGRLKAAVEDMGSRTLKNVREPVKVFRMRRESGDARPAPDTRDRLRDQPSIAVLPFENMSGDPEQEYFSDGLAEDIITALSHWRSFPVIARNSSFSYKGRHVRTGTIARELGVRYLVEGSVRKAGSRVRVTAQLIDAATDGHLWAEKFDRHLEDIFELQDEITHLIASKIMPELENFEHRRSRQKRPEDLQAWDFYLRGMATFFDYTCEGTREAVQMFRAAVEHDPGYADAWARLGWSCSRLVQFGCAEDREESIAAGYDAARKALALDDDSAVAHMALGSLHIMDERPEIGLAEAQRALALNPNFAHAAMAVGNRLDLVGQSREGIAQMERALALNPRDPSRWRYLAYLSRAHVSLGDYERGAACARQALQLRPDHEDALFRCAVAVAHLDDPDATRRLVDACLAADPDYLARKAGWSPYPDPDRNRHLLDGLRRQGFLPAG